MTRLSNSIDVPIAQLTLSPLNVRPASEREDVDDLAANILERGLLQNLGVVPADQSTSGLYEVVFGGRRLKALHKLLENGDLKADDLVPCRALTADEAASVASSMAENFLRKAMSPVAEFEAYAQLESLGRSITEIAADFGATERHVKERLRLGNAAPCVRNALRAGDISLDVAKAFCASSDPALQELVFNSFQGAHMSPYSVRQRLFEDAAADTSALAKFVGRDAYEAAGGAITTDLFQEDFYFEDAALLQSLAETKVTELAEELQADGWSWVEGRFEYPSDMNGAVRLHGDIVDLSDEEKAELEKLEAEFDDLLEKGEEGEFSDEDGDRYDIVDARIDELREERYEYTAEHKARAGAIVYLDEYRGVQYLYGIVRAEDVRPDDVKGPGGASGRKTAGGSAPDADAGPKISMALDSDLAIYRGLALQQAILKKPDIAHRYLIFALANKAFEFGACDLGHKASISFGLEDTSVNDLAATPGAKAVAAFKDGLNLDWIASASMTRRWSAFQKLSAKDVKAIETWLVASGVTPQKRQHQLHDNGANAIGSTLAVNVRDAWVPTDINFWSRMNKQYLLDVISEVLGAEAGAKHVGKKKAELAGALRAIFAGETDLDKGQRARVKAWLPDGMAFVDPIVDEEIDANDDDEDGETADDGIAGGMVADAA